jgi:hypothetical protein
MTQAKAVTDSKQAPPPKRAQYEASRHLYIYIRELAVHPRVQRRLDLGWARRIRDGLDPDLLGELSVVDERGKLLVFDGQHRLWACREILGEDQKVPCRIYEGLTTERLAAMFLGINRSKAVRAIDKWRQAVNARFEVETLIDSVILPRHKLSISEATTTRGGIRAVEALREIFTRYGGEPALDRTLAILGAAWNRDPESFDGPLLRGVGMLVHRFNGDLDDKHLARKLAKEGGPQKLVGLARDYAKATGVSVPRGMAERLLIVYNKARRTQKLTLTPANGA